MPTLEPSQTKTGTVGLFAVVLAAVIVGVMIFAMFSTRGSVMPNSQGKNGQNQDSQMHRFKDNLDRSFHRAFGDVL